MIKKKIYGETLKEQLVASSKDRLFNFSLADGTVRGVILNGTRMINEMRANHELGILETLVLGRAYLGGALISADLKGNDRISIQIECSGPIKGLIVEANAFGEVRGFLSNVPIPVEKPLDSFDLSPFFGAGFLSVTRYLEDAKQPFTGKVTLEYGNIAKDLANYYFTSEQIPSALNLSIKFDKDGEVTGAGGLFIQAMPGAGQETIIGLESLFENFPSLGEVFSADTEPEALIHKVFGQYAPKFLANRRIEFMCHCNKERVRSLLTMLPIEELKDILENGPFPVESRCHHCNTFYLFSESDIRRIYGKRFPDN
ncbi:MAG: Hsp33 family molecular chaperone HslO [Deltaproteobacteria bacterium]|nr:MAG: Hsp33 family molecular chaperone HslO [Deltaproteobacteria bacterium]